VRRALAQRQLTLAGIALLGIAVSIAVSTRHTHHAAAAVLPRSYGSYTALAAASLPVGRSRTGACGDLVGPRTVGVESPVLPCGVRLYLSYRGRTVLAPVVDVSSAPGAALVLTSPLARRLGISGVRRVRWSYAATN
jgi:hypothetical protein